MTIDEAIRHAEEVARQNEDDAILYKNCKEIKRNTYEVLTAEAAEQKCLSCAAEHRQLAEWLTELKELKNSIGAVRLNNMTEALKLIRAYKAENIAQKKLIAEYKRLLKAAVEDIHKKCSCECSHYKDRDCDICVNEITCDYDSRFQWVHEAEALKLIGEDENET